MITKYDRGSIEWVTELIAKRAERMGFAGADLDDAVQEIVLPAMRFRYDEARSNGATLRTALTSVIDRHLLAIRRRESRYARHLDGARRMRAELAGSDGPQEELSYEETTALTLDVRTALASLSREEQQICEALSHGYSVQQIADQLGRDWHTVNRRIAGIRERFAQLGLDGWLEVA